MSQWNLLLFDLGGVLIDFDGIQPMIELSKNRMDAEMIRRTWLLSPWVQRYQTGRCSAREFSEGFVKEVNLEIPPDLFLQHFYSWQRGFMPGAVELLTGLKQRYKIGCLSNINEMHWDMLIRDEKITRLFNVCYASHLIGKVKPDPEIFTHVIRDQALPAQRIAYFDDNLECVEAAESVGLKAFLVNGVEEVKGKLKSIGVIFAEE